MHPGWRFAYSRPGLVTFRTDTAVAAGVTLLAVFARSYGVSIGPAADDAQVVALSRRLTEAGGAPPVLHVFERDRARPGEQDEGDDYGPLAAEVRDRLLAAAPAGSFASSPLPRAGEKVLDVIAAPGEPLFFGFHEHGDHRSPYPGGRVPLSLPVEAPSRAWLKIEEALRWSGLPVRAGEVAVEIGSAPGGASWALLERGLTVIGVDPGTMDPRVLSRPEFIHLKRTLGDLRREQLPARVDWLLLDVNLAPQVALHGIRRIVSTLRNTLCGVVFTLKLNDWKMAAEVPALLSRVAGMGLSSVRATQLAANRREICVVARSPSF
jgi:23S rRNA (cytidine2498-2'-O)-methyltransferase